MSNKKPELKLVLGGSYSQSAFAKLKKCSRQTVIRAMSLGYIDSARTDNGTGAAQIIATARTMNWIPGKTVPKKFQKREVQLKHLKTKVKK